jgi:hypothetical protein
MVVGFGLDILPTAASGAIEAEGASWPVEVSVSLSLSVFIKTRDKILYSRPPRVATKSTPEQCPQTQTMVDLTKVIAISRGVHSIGRNMTRAN